MLYVAIMTHTCSVRSACYTAFCPPSHIPPHILFMLAKVLHAAGDALNFPTHIMYIPAHALHGPRRVLDVSPSAGNVPRTLLTCCSGSLQTTER